MAENSGRNYSRNSSVILSVVLTQFEKALFELLPAFSTSYPPTAKIKVKNMCQKYLLLANQITYLFTLYSPTLIDYNVLHDFTIAFTVYCTCYKSYAIDFLVV